MRFCRACQRKQLLPYARNFWHAPRQRSPHARAAAAPLPSSRVRGSALLHGHQACSALAGHHKVECATCHGCAQQSSQTCAGAGASSLEHAQMACCMLHATGIGFAPDRLRVPLRISFNCTRGGDCAAAPVRAPCSAAGPNGPCSKRLKHIPGGRSLPCMRSRQRRGGRAGGEARRGVGP